MSEQKRFWILAALLLLSIAVAWFLNTSASDVLVKDFGN